MEREIVLTTQTFRGVTFKNFPSYKDPESGEVTFNLIEEVMCEDVAKQIPSKLRKAISVDFSLLDYNRLIAETKSMHGIERTMTNEQLRTTENNLIETIFENQDGHKA